MKDCLRREGTRVYADRQRLGGIIRKLALWDWNKPLDYRFEFSHRDGLFETVNDSSTSQHFLIHLRSAVSGPADNGDMFGLGQFMQLAGNLYSAYVRQAKV